MHNRKLNIQKDFNAVNELENVIMPICETIKDEEARNALKLYIRKIFNNQFKN
jgi:hypothetical protein